MSLLTERLEDVPSLLVNGEKDVLCTRKDLKHLKTHMPKGTKFVEVKDYNHLDMVWAYDAHTKFHEPHIIPFLKEKAPPKV